MNLIQHAALEAIGGNKIHDIINRDGFTFDAKDLIAIMQIEVDQKAGKMPAQHGNDLLSMGYIVNIRFKNFDHRNHLPGK